MEEFIHTLNGYGWVDRGGNTLSDRTLSERDHRKTIQQWESVTGAGQVP